MRPMRYLALMSFLATAGSTLGACAAPKVLVDQEFLGNNRTAKIIIQNTGSAFDTFVRVCTLIETGEERDCVDTLVLTNVTPGAFY